MGKRPRGIAARTAKWGEPGGGAARCGQGKEADTDARGVGEVEGRTYCMYIRTCVRGEGSGRARQQAQGGAVVAEWRTGRGTPRPRG